MPKPAEPPRKEPVLLTQPPVTAREKIQERIRKGEVLRHTTVNTEAEAAEFSQTFKKWNDYNETLLTTLFTSNEPMMKYRWSVSLSGLTTHIESPYERYERHLRDITSLCNELESLNEKLDLIPLAPGVASAPPTRPSADAVWPFLHPKVVADAQERFRSGQYADAVEAAFKALNHEVKAIAKQRGVPEQDGASLMRTMFSPKNPVIVLADLSNQTGKDMQQGYMDLFAGSMSAIRNPKAHGNITISPERAIHLLFVASTLWFTLDARM